MFWSVYAAVAYYVFFGDDFLDLMKFFWDICFVLFGILVLWIQEILGVFSSGTYTWLSDTPTPASSIFVDSGHPPRLIQFSPPWDDFG